MSPLLSDHVRGERQASDSSSNPSHEGLCTPRHFHGYLCLRRGTPVADTNSYNKRNVRSPIFPDNLKERECTREAKSLGEGQGTKQVRKKPS